MTLRAQIIRIIDCVEDQDDTVCMDQAADAILAVVREHMTTDEAVGAAWGEWLSRTDTGIPAMTAAILAALGGQP